MATPRRISVQANLEKKEAMPTVRRVIERLRAGGVEVTPRADLAQALGERADEAAYLDEPDLLICLGGTAPCSTPCAGWRGARSRCWASTWGGWDS